MSKEKLKDQKKKYQFSDFQKSERDFAFIIDKTFKVQELVKIISEIDNSLIRDVKSVKPFSIISSEMSRLGVEKLEYIKVRRILREWSKHFRDVNDLSLIHI